MVVDVDTGTDDAMALLLLLAADAAGEVVLEAVTCVAGNTGLGNVCRNTLRLLRAANRLDVPVFAGAEGPLVAERPITNTYHGVDGFGDLDHTDFPGDDAELDAALQEENAVVALNRIVNENPGRVSLVCLAPLTNIALAVRTYPAFRGQLRDAHIMGGNTQGLGNTTPAAEFNFGADPEAAQIVLESLACPVQLTPWETCPEHAIPLEWRLETLPALGAGGLALQLLTAADRAVNLSKAKTLWTCCDQLAVAALLRPGLVLRTLRRHLTVELAGSRTRGQAVPACVCRGGQCPPACAGPDRRLNAGAPPATILDGFDVDAFKELLVWAAARWTRAPRAPEGADDADDAAGP